MNIYECFAIPATSHGDLVEKSSGVFECHLNNITITVLKGDITTVDADAIVTSTNAKLELASGKKLPSCRA